MFQIADHATNFKACVIIRKGTEGTMCMSLSRPAEFIVGVRGEGGRLQRYQFQYGVKDLGVNSLTEKEQQYALTTSTVAAKIAAYAKVISPAMRLLYVEVMGFCWSLV